MWKNYLEIKGLRVNMGKTKVMLCAKGLDRIKTSGKYASGVCRPEYGGIQFTVKVARYGYIMLWN